MNLSNYVCFFVHSFCVCTLHIFRNMSLFGLFAVCPCVRTKACVCPGVFACMHMCVLACVRLCVGVSVSLGSVQVKELQEERGQGFGTVAMILSTGLSPHHPPPPTPISAPCVCTISAALACLLSVILMESERESPGWGNPPGENNCFTSLVLMAAKAMPGMHTVH